MLKASQRVLLNNKQTLQQSKRFFASANQQGPFVLIDKNTKVICQGFTGKQVIKRLFINLRFAPREHFTLNKQ
jgi:hypothetical protein